jgi:opacity protein-like surface antigen
MFRKTMLAVVLGVSAMLLLPGPAAAQQSIAINLGVFTPARYDARPNEDVLVQDLNYHYFDIKEFDGFTFSGEWLIPLGQFLEAGVGVGFYQNSVPAVYIDYVNDATGGEIAQEFKLRVVPITGMLRVLPFGRRAAVQPYLAAGVGILPWRYSETGQFIDANGDIFNDAFVGSGTAVGPVVGGGVRFAVSPGFALGGEIRHQWGEGNLNGNEFNGTKIDLGGFTYLGTLIFRF